MEGEATSINAPFSQVKEIPFKGSEPNTNSIPTTKKANPFSVAKEQPEKKEPADYAFLARNRDCATDAEKKTIAIVFLYPKILKKYPGIDERIFQDRKHRILFKTIKKMSCDNIPIEQITIIDELNKSKEIKSAGGIDYISTFTNDVFTDANFIHYLRLTVEASKALDIRKSNETLNENSDTPAWKKRNSKIERLYKKMLQDPEDLQQKEEIKQLDLSGNINPELLNYEHPLKLAQLLTATASDDREQLHNFFFYNMDVIPQACAALYLHKLYGDSTEPRLKKSVNTVWQYIGFPGYFWRPVANLTKPKNPFEPLSFLKGEQYFIELFGQDIFIKDNEGKTKSKHYNRGNDFKIATHFFTYCDVFLPDDRRFFIVQPKPVVSCKNGIFLLKENKLIDHSPTYNQTIPAFPYKYIEPEKLNEEHKLTITQYLCNLGPVDEMEKFAIYMGWRIGYTLTSWREKRFFVDIGPSDTGKTSLLENIGRLHRDTDTIRNADFCRMSVNPGDFDNAVFDRALVVLNDDFPPAGKLPAQILKTIANKNTTIQINQKYKPSYSRVNTATIFLSTNSDPKSPDPYIANRIICTPFDNVFEDSQANDDLMEKMHNPEIEETLFNYGIMCMVDYFNSDGLDSILPGCVKQKTAEVIGSMNDAFEWLKEEIEEKRIIESPYSTVKKSALYNAYINSRGNRAIGRNSFYLEIGQKYKTVKKSEMYFTGLSIYADPAGGFYE